MTHMPRDSGMQYKLGELLAKHLAAANMLGRMQIARTVLKKTGKKIPVSQISRKPTRSFDDATDALGDQSLALGFRFKLPADTPAQYLRNLTPVTRETFDGLSAQYKRDAFTISGVSDVRLIEKVRDELAQVLQDGGTQRDFDAAVRKMTSEAGVAEINAFTLDTVFTTNMQKAYSLGRYEQMTVPDVADALPFWQYMTVGDMRVRPEHRAIDGFTARVVDPVWRKIYPPNGFNCRCIVVALLAEEAPDNASEPGYGRLPPLAVTGVPQQGFTKVF